MSRMYDRNYEYEMVELLNVYGYSAEDILEHFLSWLSSDQTCGALEDFFNDNDIELPQ